MQKTNIIPIHELGHDWNRDELLNHGLRIHDTAKHLGNGSLSRLGTDPYIRGILESPMLTTEIVLKRMLSVGDEAADTQEYGALEVAEEHVRGKKHIQVIGFVSVTPSVRIFYSEVGNIPADAMQEIYHGTVISGWSVSKNPVESVKELYKHGSHAAHEHFPDGEVVAIETFKPKKESTNKRRIRLGRLTGTIIGGDIDNSAYDVAVQTSVPFRKQDGFFRRSDMPRKKAKYGQLFTNRPN